MALDESSGSGMYMPVAPAYGGSGSGFGFGGDWAWIILLLVLCGGWGNGFGGGFGGADSLYPWLNNTQGISEGFAGVNSSICNAQSAITQQLYTNQIADMERSFAAQTASAQGMSALQAQLAQCCCENRAATQDLKYTLATEACNTRASSTANTQAILDKLCQLELDAKNDTIAQLRSQINELGRAASQNAQTSAIIANNEAQTTALERYLAPTPIPAYIVQNPACCGQNYGCGCGA